MDSVNPFMQALSQALITRLASTVPAGNLAADSPAFKKILDELACKLISGSLSKQSLSPPQTPEYQKFTGVTTPVSAAGVVLEPDTPLSRSSSGCSSISSSSTVRVKCEPGTPLSRSASSVSTSSHISTSSKENADDDDVVFIKRRKRTTEQDAIDSKVVTEPILRHFDSKFLALDPAREDNPLYEHRVRAGFEYADEHARPRKKFQDMKMNVFKRESRIIIRRLTSANLSKVQELDPTVTYEELRRRYEKMALKVVRKRRANHVQSWRPEKNGTHKPLIYGGTVPPVRKAPCVQNPVDKDPKPSQKRADQDSKPSQKRADKDYKPSQKRADKDSKSKSASVVGVEFLVGESGSETEEEMTCDECGVQLSDLCAYPKDRWGSDMKVWCELHWQEHQDKMVCQHISDVKARKRKMRELEKLRQQRKIERNDKGGDSDQDDNGGSSGGSSDKPPPNKRKKKQHAKKCKWCGSTTHFRKTSLECPFNKKNRAKRAFAVGNSDDKSKAPDDKSKAPDVVKPAPKQLDAKQAAAKQPDAAKPAVKQPDAAKPTPKKHVFNPGDNVTVTLGRKVYLGQLYKIQGDKYHVYYVDTGETAILSLKQLSPDKFKERTRAQYLNAEFYCDGLEEDKEQELPAVSAGRWKVHHIDGNEYVCTRLSGGGKYDINLVNFDIGYVIFKVREEEEYVRERGPFCTGRR